MSIATRFSSLLPKPRYQRRPRVMVSTKARHALSRERRWRKRRSSPVLNMIGSMLAGLGIAAAVWTIFFAETGEQAEVIAFPDFVAEVEGLFPEAVQGYTRAVEGTLSDGQSVPVAVTMLLPAHALESAAAAPDALTRLSAPFVGKEQAISGEEMGERVARIATMALPENVSRCYTYTTEPARRVITSQNRALFVTPLTIVFNPEC